MNRNILLAIVASLAVAGLVFILTRKNPPPASPADLAPSFASAAAPNPMSPPTAQPVAPVTIDPAQVKAVPGQTLDLATVALEAKMISNAEALLAAGKPRDSLKQIDAYEHVPDRAALVPEATFVKIEALARVGGRKTDALALAMQARLDPAMDPYRARIEDVLADAGVSGGVTSAAP